MNEVQNKHPFSLRWGDVIVTVLGFAVLLAWDSTAGKGDLWLASLMGGSAGFALRHDFWLEVVLHDVAKKATQMVFLVLVIQAWWSKGVWKGMTKGQRAWPLFGMLVLAAMIPVLKRSNATHCPYDLLDFGGAYAYQSHWWGWQTSNEAMGHCFPAGHASTGFVFFVLYFWWRDERPQAAKIVLISTIIWGSILGLSQQMRGAHFMSHTLWTAWICWTVGALTVVLGSKMARQTS